MDSSPTQPPFSAVLFDLYGTLVAPLTKDRRNAVSAEMAADLGVDGDEFAAAVRASFAERCLGRLGGLEATVAALAARCGGRPGPAQIQRAAARRVDLSREFLASDPKTIEALAGLKRRGLHLGLVSDCSIETASAWHESPLSEYVDCAAFSCLLGIRKPDPRIYRHVLRTLELEPAGCLYVGDGDSGELTGARRLGMTAIRICRPGSQASDRYSDDAGFRGPQIAAVAELLEAPWTA